MTVTGRAVVLTEPPSFWGGFDAATGRIIEARHPDRGVVVGGSVLVLETTKGSSGGAAMISLAIKRGVGPVAFVLRRPTLDVAIGTLTPEILYGIETPYAVADPDTFDAIRNGDLVRIDSSGGIKLVG